MPMRKPEANDWKLAVLGLAIGASVTIATLELDAHPWVSGLGFPVIGFVIGLLIRTVVRDWLSGASDLGIKELSFDFPLIGSTSIALTNAQLDAVNALYVELTNRVVAQSLRAKDGTDAEPEDAGNLREAMTSIYKAVVMIRETLKDLPTDEQRTLELALRGLINNALRPFLSRWHPRLKAWEDTSRPESLWPLARLCRDDLEITRGNALLYLMSLAEGLGIAEGERQLFDLTPENEPTELQPLTPIAEVRSIEAGLRRGLAAAQAQHAWRFLVELATLVPWVEASMREGEVLDDEALKALLAMLPELTNRLRYDLRELPHSLWVAAGDEALESVAMRLVRRRLQPFVDRFAATHPTDKKALAVCRSEWHKLAALLASDLAAIDRLTDGVLLAP